MTTDAMLFDGYPDPEPESDPTEGMGTDAKHTERTMLDALHDRYSQASQGVLRRWVCAEHVRSGAGFDRRCADFIAQDTWQYQGLALHGHEVKVSRSDWLRELADPDKAAAVKRYCDRWWLVVPDRRIVRDDLPEDWGLLDLDAAGRLRIAKRAPKLAPDSISASFRAALLRAVAKTASRRGDWS